MHCLAPGELYEGGLGILQPKKQALYWLLPWNNYAQWEDGRSCDWPGCFVIPSPWALGSVKAAALLSSLDSWGPDCRGPCFSRPLRTFAPRPCKVLNNEGDVSLVTCSILLPSGCCGGSENPPETWDKSATRKILTLRFACGSNRPAPLANFDLGGQ